MSPIFFLQSDKTYLCEDSPVAAGLRRAQEISWRQERQDVERELKFQNRLQCMLLFERTRVQWHYRRAGGLFREPGNHFPGSGKSFSGNREVIFREPERSFPECLSFLSEGEAE